MAVTVDSHVSVHLPYKEILLLIKAVDDELVDIVFCFLASEKTATAPASHETKINLL